MDKPRPLLSIPDDAKDAVNKKPVSQKLANQRTIQAQKIIAKVCNDQIRFALFGSRMKPTLRQQLLMWSSHRAIKTAWASREFTEKLRAAAGN